MLAKRAHANWRKQREENRQLAFENKLRLLERTDSRSQATKGQQSPAVNVRNEKGESEVAEHTTAKKRRRRRGGDE